MSESLLILLSTSEGFKDAMSLLKKLHETFDEAPPEKRHELACEIPNLISNFPELSSQDLPVYISLLIKIFDLLNSLQKQVAILLLLNNVSLDFCIGLGKEEYSVFYKLLLKISEFGQKNCLDFFEEEASRSIPTLLFRTAYFIVGCTGRSQYPEMVFPSKYSTIRNCLIAIMDSSKMRESDFGYVMKADISLTEWLGFFTVLCNLHKKICEKNPVATDFIGNILYNAFNHFLRKVLHKRREELLHERFISWTNQVIVWIAAVIDAFDFKVKKVAKNLNKKYIFPFSFNKKFRKCLVTQFLSHQDFTSLKVFSQLDFAPVEEINIKEQKSQAVIKDDSLSSISRITKAKPASFSKVLYEYKISDSNGVGEDESLDKNAQKDFDSIFSKDELFDQLSNLENFGEGNDNSLDESLLDLQNMLNERSNRSLALSLYSASAFEFEEEKKKIQEVYKAMEQQLCDKDIPKLKTLDHAFLLQSLEPFILDFTKRNDAEMKKQLKPFYDYFLHSLKVKLDKLHYIKFTISPWSNCNETYYVGGEELCVTVSNFNYHPNYLLKKVEHAFKFSKEKIVLTSRSRIYKPDDPRSAMALDYLTYNDTEKRFTVQIYANHLAPCIGAKLITKYCQLDPRLPQMLSFILHWAKKKGVLDPSSGYLSSYAFTLIVIFFLQIQEDCVLPSIQLCARTIAKLEKSISIPSFDRFLTTHNESEHSDGVVDRDNIEFTKFDFSFNDVDPKEIIKSLHLPKNSETTSELVTKFFYYFGFDYPELYKSINTRKMSILNGKYLPINPLADLDFPFIIEDPIDPSFNPGYTMTKRYFKIIIYEFRVAYLAIVHNDPRILEIPYKGL